MTDQDMEIWKAGYDLHNKYGEGPNTDEGWTDLANDCRDLYERFGKSEFAFHMGMMILDYYGDKYSKRATVRTCEQMRIGM